MTQQNRWALGTMYYGGKLNGVPFWQQSAPFEPVYPTEVQGQTWEDYPGAGVMTFAYGGWVNPGCQHIVKWFCIIQEYDYEQNQPVQLLTCPTCSYVQRAVYGTDQNGMPELYDPLLYAVIVA